MLADTLDWVVTSDDPDIPDIYYPAVVGSFYDDGLGDLYEIVWTDLYSVTHSVKYRYLPLEEENPDISGQFHPYMAYQGKHVVKKHHEEKPKIFLTYLQYDNMVYRHRYGEYPRAHTFKDGIRVDLQTWPLVPLGSVVKMTAGETQGQKGVVSSQPQLPLLHDPRPKFCLASPLEPIRRSDAKAKTR